MLLQFKIIINTLTWSLRAQSLFTVFKRLNILYFVFLSREDDNNVVLIKVGLLIYCKHSVTLVSLSYLPRLFGLLCLDDRSEKTTGRRTLCVNTALSYSFYYYYYSVQTFSSSSFLQHFFFFTYYSLFRFAFIRTATIKTNNETMSTIRELLPPRPPQAHHPGIDFTWCLPNTMQTQLCDFYVCAYSMGNV